jgi:TrpR-related protein YerC/YecD
MPKKINNWNQKEVEDLGRVFLGLKNIDEFKKFIRDLCTLEEIGEMGKRWQAVVLIKQGVTYRVIAKKLGLSTTTVARVAHWLRYGRGGYRLAIERRRRK